MKKNMATKIVQQILILGLVTLFLFASVGLTNSKNVSSAGFTPTLTPISSQSSLLSYPPPVNDSPNRTTISAYPAPGTNPTQLYTKPTQPAIPTDRIVGISNDGQIYEVDQNLSSFSKRITVNKDSKFVLPTIPERNNSPSPMRIIGPDDRFQIQDTTIFPWDTVVRIEGKLTPNILFSCTGWMLGPSTVVTAGHCVYDFPGTKTYAYDVKITPGFNAASANPSPFGSCMALQGIVLTPWFNNGDIGYDYGIYKLGCRIGLQTGNLGFKVISGNGVGTSTALTGYPGDKGGDTMWAGLGSITSSDTNSFYYNNDTMSGQSGSPVWDYVDQACSLCVVAVHANNFDPPTMNQGARINNTAFNFLLSSQQFIANQVFLPIVLNQ